MARRKEIRLEVTQQMIDEARRHQVSGRDLMTLARTMAVKKVYPDAVDITYDDEHMSFTLPGEDD
jgi:hypothetical protein